MGEARPFALLAIVACSFASPARASFAWDGECSPPRPLAERVAELAGGDRGAIEARVRVERADGAFRMIVELPDRARVVHAATCEPLFEAAAVIVMVAALVEEAEPIVEPVLPSASELAAPIELAAPAIDPQPPAIVAAPLIGAIGFSGLESDLSIGPALGLDVTYDFVRARALWHVQSPTTVDSATNQRAFTTIFTGGSFDLCARPVEGPPTLGICARAAFGWFFFDPDDDDWYGASRVDDWIAFGGTLAMDLWDLRPGRIFLELGFAVTPWPARYHVAAGDGTYADFNSGEVSGQLAVGIAFDTR